MKPLDAQEWLEGQRLAGCRFADELLELLAGKPQAIDNAAAIEDLRDRVPEEIAKLPDLWRTVEWITDRLAMLDEVESIIAKYTAGIVWPNGTEPKDPDDKLSAAFTSARWLEHDL